jgi:RimJ/RimL family protein N-acetyltransferase
VTLRLGFEDLGLHRIIGRIDARNTASARVLERLGMRACTLLARLPPASSIGGCSRPGP